MIDIKNRSRETKTYQYTTAVSAGPVRPQVLNVVRTTHDPKTGETTRAPTTITVGGVLTIPAKSELKNMPDVLLDHPTVQLDIESRALSVKKHKTADPKKSSVAPTEAKSGKGKRTSSSK